MATSLKIILKHVKTFLKHFLRFFDIFWHAKFDMREMAKNKTTELIRIDQIVEQKEKGRLFW